jgi:hypothetical protein
LNITASFSVQFHDSGSISCFEHQHNTSNKIFFFWFIIFCILLILWFSVFNLTTHIEAICFFNVLQMFDKMLVWDKDAVPFSLPLLPDIVSLMVSKTGFRHHFIWKFEKGHFQMVELLIYSLYNLNLVFNFSSFFCSLPKLWFFRNDI